MKRTWHRAPSGHESYRDLSDSLAGPEKALRGALGYRRPDVVGHGAEIDRQPSEKFAFVDVGGQLTDEVAILRLVEQLLELSAQVFHSVDHAPLLKKSPTSN